MWHAEGSWPSCGHWRTRLLQASTPNTSNHWTTSSWLVLWILRSSMCSKRQSHQQAWRQLASWGPMLIAVLCSQCLQVVSSCWCWRNHSQNPILHPMFWNLLSLTLQGHLGRDRAETQSRTGGEGQRASLEGGWCNPESGEGEASCRHRDLENSGPYSWDWSQRGRLGSEVLEGKADVAWHVLLSLHTLFCLGTGSNFLQIFCAALGKFSQGKGKLTQRHGWRNTANSFLPMMGTTWLRVSRTLPSTYRSCKTALMVHPARWTLASAKFAIFWATCFTFRVSWGSLDFPSIKSFWVLLNQEPSGCI